MSLKGLFEIKEVNIDQCNLMAIVSIDKNHDIFKGHFPDSPVTPGVTLINLIKEIAEMSLQKALRLTEIKNVKFLKLIDPFKLDQLLVKASVESDSALIRIKAEILVCDEVAVKISALMEVVG